MHTPIAKIYRVKGRVQGVGFRYFVQQHAETLGVRGYVRNEDNGDVFVYAIATHAVHQEFAGHIHKGPHFSDVRGVEVSEAELMKYSSFHIEH